MKKYKNLIEVQGKKGTYMKYQPETVDDFIDDIKKLNLDKTMIKFNATKYGFNDQLDYIMDKLKETTINKG
ncbi:hypothetical protein [Clostridium disporicum]|uniref:hypothetical protein n=1 Tax=Clostridium disporicum TaxID=84024 RepID=UPI0034A2D6E7